MYSCKPYILFQICHSYQSLHSSVDECLKAEEKLTMVELERDQNSTIDQIFLSFFKMGI
jgi:hypothetical protein